MRQADSPTDWLVTLAAAQGAEPEPGRLSALLLRHGSMSLRFYAPHGSDSQTPHDQDEIYVVATGSATIACGPTEDRLEVRACAAGDAIFVPAGHVHRFQDMSSDFATWVIFWGPKGGEQG